MSPVPAAPSIYHITHEQNLAAILEDGGLWSDAVMIKRGGPTASIGMGEIKRKRLALSVKCHAGDFVGQYVPFYFCPRSVMLYVIQRANHQNLTYRGGQEPIIHFEAALAETVQWADSETRRWAFTLSNAGAAYTECRADTRHLDEIDWDAVRSTDFRQPEVKEGKQAEFLVHEFFPWTLVRRIGVRSSTIHSRVVRTIANHTHRPKVEVIPSWYY